MPRRVQLFEDDRSRPVSHLIGNVDVESKGGMESDQQQSPHRPTTVAQGELPSADGIGCSAQT